jgi:hypothetical protein
MPGGRLSIIIVFLASRDFAHQPGTHHQDNARNKAKPAEKTKPVFEFKVDVLVVKQVGRAQHYAQAAQSIDDLFDVVRVVQPKFLFRIHHVSRQIGARGANNS